MYLFYIRDSKYMKQNLIKLKAELDKFIVTVRDFNIPLSMIDKQMKGNTSIAM